MELLSQQARLAEELSKAGGKRGQNRRKAARKTGPHHARIRLSGRGLRDSKTICYDASSYGGCGWRSILMTRNMKFPILSVRSMSCPRTGRRCCAALATSSRNQLGPTASGGTGRVASNAGIPADCGARRNRLIDANDSRVYLGLIPALLPVPTRNGESMLQAILYRCWLNLRFPRVAKSVASLLPELEKDWEMFRPGALGNVQHCGCRKSPAIYGECGGDVLQTDMFPLGQKDAAWEK